MSLHGYASRTIASVVIGLILSHTGLALRFIARWEGKLKPTVDDYLILLAMVSLNRVAAFNVDMLMSCRYHTGDWPLEVY